MSEADRSAARVSAAAYMAQQRVELAFAKVVAGYCDISKAWDESGGQDVLDDWQIMQIGAGLAVGSPLTGPASPAVAHTGGALFAIGAVRFTTHLTWVLQKSATEPGQSPPAKPVAIFNKPGTNDAGAEYSLTKVLAHALNTAGKMSGGPSKFAFPLADECKLLEQRIRAIEEREHRRLEELERQRNSAPGIGEARRSVAPSASPSGPGRPSRDKQRQRKYQPPTVPQQSPIQFGPADSGKAALDDHDVPHPETWARGGTPHAGNDGPPRFSDVA
ncbi:hypothetical protein [Hydrogenophaga sp.]